MKKVFLFFFITLFIATGVFAENNAYQPYWYLHDGDGDPCVGCYLYTYEVGTTTPKAVYTDSDCSIAASNPVVLDSRGEAAIYICDEYKFVLKDADGVTIRTIDDVGDPATSSSSTTYAYYPDASESDQGATASGTGDTIYDIISEVGASEYAKIVLRHDGSSNTTAYTFDTSLDLEDYPYVYIEFEPGAQLARTTGDETLAVYSPNNIIAPKDLKITTAAMLFFDEPGVVYPDWWEENATPGTTDMSTAIQSAINALGLSLGGVVEFMSETYACANLELKSYVALRGLQPNGAWSHAVGVRRNNKTVLLANDAGDVIGTPTTNIVDCAVENINFVGLGSATNVRGLYLDDVDYSLFSNLQFDNFYSNAIKIDEGNANFFQRCQAISCLMNPSLSAQDGVINIGSVAAYDNRFFDVEVTCSNTSLSSANMYYAAWYFGTYGSSNFLTDCAGQTSDIGMYLGGDNNSFVGCRFDLNWAHGVRIVSGASNNRFESAWFYRNSKESTQTYDGMHLENGASNNVFTGCLSYSLAADAWQQRYGFYSANNSSAQKNWFSNCFGSENYGTNGDDGNFYGNPYLGDSFHVNAVRQFTANDATPSIADGNTFWFPAYTGATDITDFLNGTPNQIIHVIDTQADGYITIKNNANIVTSTGGDINISQNVVYSFIHVNGVWRHLTN